MIKIKKTDSIIDIILKMKSSNEKELVLEFPFGHPVLHNYTSLKILKTKAEKKELIIVTNDKTSQKIGTKLGIKYSLIPSVDIIEYNYSFWEYLVYTLKKYLGQFKDTLLQNKGPQSITSKYHRLYTSGKVGFFLIFLLISFFLLIFIFYFAVNKTYVYITPNIEVKSRTHNFIFQEMGEEEITLDEKIIKLKKITKTVNMSSEFGTSGVDDSATTKASGVITLHNLSEEEIVLMEKTRVQTSSGIIFTINSEVTVPSASKDGSRVIPGTTDANVTAKIHDIDGNIVGEKGNIKKGITMNLPGLKDNGRIMYGVSKENFHGGTNNFVQKLTKEDIEKAKKILKAKLEEKGKKTIETELSFQNSSNDVQFSILEADNTILYEDFNVTGEENYEIGEKRDKFELYGTLKVIAYTYNREILLGKMRNEISSKLLDDVEEILNMNEDSIQVVNEIYRKKSPFRIKASMQMDIYYIKNFKSSSNNFVYTLKNSITGLSKQEAEKVLLNSNEMSRVKIETRPFFIHSVSNIVENIEFRVNKKEIEN